MDEKKILKITRVSFHDRKEGRIQIRIVGKWLQTKGFQAGDFIRIETLKTGQLLLTRME
ncbi:hypothetical protein KAW18_19305 [candidate division WOR-3 bacterium]|nr:hypothetical protein [candidate division WOR-3 bacterium]